MHEHAGDATMHEHVGDATMHEHVGDATVHEHVKHGHIDDASMHDHAEVICKFLNHLIFKNPVGSTWKPTSLKKQVGANPGAPSTKIRIR